ncbi:hypothetical protein TgHK011_005783 [Trichoderma gracile]|nr:hypothetical protein TgHK011_005783 [Trichoderma gracile]
MSYSPTEASSRPPSVVTPSSSELTTIANLRLRDDPSDAVPWPGNAYQIVEQSTGRLLALWVGCLQLMDARSVQASEVSWLCVEANGYYGLFHPRSNTYLSAHAPGVDRSSTFGPDHYFIPRRHPKGGNQLLSPAGSDALKQLAVMETFPKTTFS